MAEKTRRLTIGERFERISEATKKRRVVQKPKNWNQIKRLLNKIARDAGVSLNSIREFCGLSYTFPYRRLKPAEATISKLEKSLNIEFKESGKRRRKK